MSITTTIQTTHKKYTKYLPKWTLIDDICDAENLDDYIVELNPADKTAENIARNKAYKARAVYANIAGYTQRGLTGMVFRKWPTLTIPEALGYVKRNVDGAGVSIYQQSQSVLKSLIRKGRAGLLVDYPLMEGVASRADMLAGRVFATIQRFEPEQIINWAIVADGATVKLARVVISDTIDECGEDIKVYRELSLVDGFYNSVEYRVIDGNWQEVHRAIPLDGSGKPWEYIPFTFVGSETNTHTIDSPPMYDICKVNIGHYNNSAEYEDSVFIVGQPQPWMSGLTQDYLDILNANNMYIGSGRLIGVPEGQQLNFAQAQPNSLVKEAMDSKVQLAIGMGAIFIQPGSAVKTATQAEGDQLVQHSVLSLIASNLSEAYTQCLKWVARYMNVDTGIDEIEYTVNQDFINNKADAQTITAMLQMYLQKGMPFSQLVRWQKKTDLVDPEMSMEDIKAELETVPALPDLSGNMDGVDD
jgi:hypothetical protein